MQKIFLFFIEKKISQLNLLNKLCFIVVKVVIFLFFIPIPSIHTHINTQPDALK
jgi:hypothetical protein